MKLLLANVQWYQKAPEKQSHVGHRYRLRRRRDAMWRLRAAINLDFSKVSLSGIVGVVGDDIFYSDFLMTDYVYSQSDY